MSTSGIPNSGMRPDRFAGVNHAKFWTVSILERMVGRRRGTVGGESPSLTP